MLSTSVPKIVASVFVVLASAGGMAGVEKSTTNGSMNGSINGSRPAEIPVALDSTSLLVATLANGEIERHWMARDVCERIASAVTAGDSVAGVRDDGVRVTIARANCSTRRIEVDQTAMALSSAQIGN